MFSMFAIILRQVCVQALNMICLRSIPSKVDSTIFEKGISPMVTSMKSTQVSVPLKPSMIRLPIGALY